MSSTRLDVRLVELGLAPSRERAQSLVRAGQVLVDERVVDKPGTKVAEGAVCGFADVHIWMVTLDQVPPLVGVKAPFARQRRRVIMIVPVGTVSRA